jgi:glycogen operon protein
MRTRPGYPYPLGATWDGAGVNFALFSEHATAVELCLYDAAGRATATGVHGPWEPGKGHRFNPAKVVIDPYEVHVRTYARPTSTA